MINTSDTYFKSVKSLILDLIIKCNTEIISKEFFIFYKDRI
jgi:hypothetical protein